MNVILDILFLRRPKIEYVSPPVCEAQFSSSSEPIIILEDIARLHSPTGLRLGGTSSRFLNWDTYPGQVCYSVYVQADPNNPNSPYNLLYGCAPNNSIVLCSPGHYTVTAIDSSGHESAPSSPFIVTGSSYVVVPLPQFPRTVCYNLYKDSVLYWGCFSGNAFQVCIPGCFKVTGITTEGETPLSNIICPSPCPVLPCPSGFQFDQFVCGCVPCPQQPCPPGQVWDPNNCRCKPSGGGDPCNALALGIETPVFEFSDAFIGPDTGHLQNNTWGDPSQNPDTASGLDTLAFGDSCFAGLLNPTASSVRAVASAFFSGNDNTANLGGPTVEIDGFSFIYQVGVSDLNCHATVVINGVSIPAGNLLIYTYEIFDFDDGTPYLFLSNPAPGVYAFTIPKNKRVQAFISAQVALEPGGSTGNFNIDYTVSIGD